MLGLASLMTVIILCVTQDTGNTPVRLRAISDQTTASVKRDEGSSPHHDSSQFSSPPRSLRSDHHANKTKQRLQLNSKFSRGEVVKWDETDNNATEVEGGKRLEKQVNRDEGRQVVEWTPQTNGMRRRVETRHNSETSSSKLQRQTPNSVGETSKAPSRILRQRRSPVKTKSSRAIRGRSLRRRSLREPRSSAGLDVKRSKTRRRRKSRTAAAARDGHHGNVNSNKRRRLNRRQWDEEEDEEEEEAEADEEEFKDERDVGLEESVQKRESDEVLISKDVLTAMNERILARVKDFIDQNTEKKLNLSSSSSPSSLLSNHSTEVSGGMGMGTGTGVGNATTEASSTFHPNSSTTH